MKKEKKQLRRHGKEVNVRALAVETRVNDRELEEFLRKRGKEKTYCPNPDTIGLNMDKVERGFGLSGVVYHSSIPSGRLRKKGTNLARS